MPRRCHGCDVGRAREGGFAARGCGPRTLEDRDAFAARACFGVEGAVQAARDVALSGRRGAQPVGVRWRLRRSRVPIQCDGERLVCCARWPARFAIWIPSRAISCSIWASVWGRARSGMRARRDGATVRAGRACALRCEAHRRSRARGKRVVSSDHLPKPPCSRAVSFFARVASCAAPAAPDALPPRLPHPPACPPATPNAPDARVLRHRDGAHRGPYARAVSSRRASARTKALHPWRRRSRS